MFADFAVYGITVIKESRKIKSRQLSDIVRFIFLKI